MQAEIVRENIIASITGSKLTEYKPMALEGSLKLGLGKVSGLHKRQRNKMNANVCRQGEEVIYVQDPDGTEFLIPGKSNNIDLEVKKAWWMHGAKYEDIPIEK